MENGAKQRTNGSQAQRNDPIRTMGYQLIKQYSLPLRIAGCVLAYLWASAMVHLGPLLAGSRDLHWVAPHWTVVLIWLPTIAAFWAGGIGMTLLCIIAAMM